MLRPIIVGVLTIGLLSVAPVAGAQATAPLPRPGIQVGQMHVSGPNWSFSANVADLSGPWGAVTLTNTNCVTPYRAGSAQAGALIFTALLTPETPETGTLLGFAGSSAMGEVQLVPMADTGGTNVTATLQGLEPSTSGTTLTVCLTQNPAPPRLATIYVSEQQVAARNFDVMGVTTAATDSDQPLIGIAGAQTTDDGTHQQLVFFYLGAGYLGTDTEHPSPAPLQVTGSPGQNQIDVSYANVGGGPPVTITYTLSNGVLMASGTPPGH
jgi:hypothetical protein